MPNSNIQESFTGDDLPPTPFEIEERRHQIISAQNALRERRRLRANNQANGHDEPQPGMTLHIQLDGSVNRRGRAGLRFEKGQRMSVTVVDASDDEVAAMQRSGKAVVNIYGAERLLEDTALHVYPTAMTEEDIGDLKAKNAALEEELRVSNEERSKLREAMRAARMAAEDKGDGRPVRMQAAKAAAAAVASTSAAAPGAKPGAAPKDAGSPKEPSSDFGGEPSK
jgi:hypothetical protein